MIPQFICPPRTRSSVLFETCASYVEAEYNIKTLDEHTELFLHTSRNATYVDAKTKTAHDMELIPIIKDNELSIHYIWPHVYGTPKDATEAKFQTLTNLKGMDKEYFIKGTLQVVQADIRLLEFWADRKFVFTLRENLVELAASWLFARDSRLFHMRPNNIHLYNDALQAGITVEKEVLDQMYMLFELLERIQKSIDYVQKKGWAYHIVYYEDLESQLAIDQTVTDILETDKWQLVRPKKELLPIKVDKNYSSVISNYSQIEEEVNKLKRNYNLDSFLRA